MSPSAAFLSGAAFSALLALCIWVGTALSRRRNLADKIENIELKNQAAVEAQADEEAWKEFVANRDKTPSRN